MNLNIPGGGKLAFVMMANGTAKFVEIDASGGNGSSAIVYVVSPTKFVLVSTSDPNPAVLLFEK